MDKQKQEAELPIDEKIEAFRAKLERYIDQKISEMRQAPAFRAARGNA
jgi:hypothetical protein